MDLSTVVDVVSIIAVVCSLVFFGVELRQFRLSRERESALELFKTFQSPEFMRGVRAITLLPDDQSREQVQELAGERMEDVYYAIGNLEGLGALVQKGELSLELVDDFFSGIIVTAWSKLHRCKSASRWIEAPGWNGRSGWLSGSWSERRGGLLSRHTSSIRTGSRTERLRARMKIAVRG